MPISVNVTDQNVQVSTSGQTVNATVSGGVGPAGPSATVSVGTVFTGAPGTSASVVNAGTSSAAILNFTIPAGAAGATGPTGATGPAGTTTWAGITDKPATFAPSSHTHGNVTNAGAIGSTAGQIVVTTTGGVLATAATINQSQVAGLEGDIGVLAPSADPTFSGVVTFDGDTVTHIEGGIIQTGVIVFTQTGLGGVQSQSFPYTTTERSKLAGIASGATANATDAQLRDRSTHTGTQAAGTITGLSTVATSGSASDLASGTLPAARLPATAVTAGSYGSATNVGTFTVGADGRMTAAGSTAISVAASAIASGTIATARLASGTASSSTYLRGDQTWSALTYLPGYSGLADADDWASRVTTAGGSVSTSTMSAVYRFCQAISAQGLRDRFWRLNLFCGTGFTTACLVPLYRGQSLTATQYGGTTDTANSFVSADYTETGSSAGGIQGDGSTKWISTGLSTSALPAVDTGHLAAYCVGGFTGSIGGIITAWNTGYGDPLYLLEANRNSVGLMYYSWGDNYLPPNITGAPGGFVMGSRISSTSMSGYRNGTSLGTKTTSVTPVSTSTQFALFCNKNPSAQSNFFAGRICGYSIGLGMNASESAAYYRAMQAFQVELGRAVYL